MLEVREWLHLWRLSSCPQDKKDGSSAAFAANILGGKTIAGVVCVEGLSLSPRRLQELDCDCTPARLGAALHLLKTPATGTPPLPYKTMLIC